MFDIYSAGFFHYRFYVKYLGDSLRRYYYSHRLGSKNEVSGVRSRNLFLREYLVGIHMKAFGPVSAYRFMPIYNAVWSLCVRIRSRPSKVSLVLLQGANVSLLKYLKKKRGIVVGEVVNCHPLVMKEIMEKDSEHHGVKFYWTERILGRKLAELNYVDYLLAPSTTVANSYVEHGFDESKIRVLPYGAQLTNSALVCGSSVSKKSGLERERRKIRIVCVAQVMPRKGQYHFVKAIAESGIESEVEVTLVGIADGAYFRAIESLGVELNYKGAVSHSCALELMREADITFLNSLEDGFGMVVMESLSVGTPVIVSKYAGASEVVRDFPFVSVVDPFDGNEIVNAINSVLGCPVEDSFMAGVISWREYSKHLVDYMNLVSYDG